MDDLMEQDTVNIAEWVEQKLEPTVEFVKGIKINRSRDENITAFGKAMMKSDYLMTGESYQDRFANVTKAYSDGPAHAQRIYDYISKGWFMPSTPVLSNGGTTRGLPVSCYLNEADDTLSSIQGLWDENIELASKGGGIGSYWGNLRSIGEKVGQNGKTSGIMPFIKVMDSLTLAISQGSLRRGSAACYLPINHPEIEEFIEMRRVTGGDPNRKATNLHHGIAVSDAFMEAVAKNADWNLLSPKNKEVVRTVRARELWIRLLIARMETGEPYILFIDAVNRNIPKHHALSGLFVKTSNLCSEITLPTGKDHLGNKRTAVCCLSSVNLEKYMEWKDEPYFIEDILRFLDNVLNDFIARAPSASRDAEKNIVEPILLELAKTLDGETYQLAEKAIRRQVAQKVQGMMDPAIYSAGRERSVGLGVMGFHGFLQQQGIPFESPLAKIWNKKIFKQIQMQANVASITLAQEKGACPDAEEHGIMERFSNKTAIAPTASISIIAGQASPGIDPSVANAYTEKRKNGSFEVRNKYLTQVLEAYGRNDDDTWREIIINGGSVQHLEFLTEKEKMVFKTAHEIDQTWVIEHAADRTPFIDQAQSVNLYLSGDTHKKVLHDVHNLAWIRGLKSLYYCRSTAVHRAQKVSDAGVAVDTFSKHKQVLAEPTKYEECTSCQ